MRRRSRGRRVLPESWREVSGNWGGGAGGLGPGPGVGAADADADADGGWDGGWDCEAAGVVAGGAEVV